MNLNEFFFTKYNSKLPISSIMLYFSMHVMWFFALSLMYVKTSTIFPYNPSRLTTKIFYLYDKLAYKSTNRTFIQ